MLDIDTAAGACGPVDGGTRPGCTAEPRVSRYFLRFDRGWKTVDRSKGAGCAGVHAVAPEFPTALCKGLSRA
ncbi:hypothetical protein AB0M36_12010 [Actinoplanes sp. NPDC051346]|uniref:hypothetical protein n=1 Tax=Actinoplanes sp. NPDC051346 TaxID=3155048 RepID=UPI003447607B